MRLIDADELKKAIDQFHQKQKERLHTPLLGSMSINNLNEIIDNAPTVECKQSIVTVPHELIEKLVLCVVDTVENIDWDKAIETYKQKPQSE